MGQRQTDGPEYRRATGGVKENPGLLRNPNMAVENAVWTLRVNHIGTGVIRVERERANPSRAFPQGEEFGGSGVTNRWAVVVLA